MHSLSISAASNTEIEDFAARIVEAMENCNKLQVAMNGEPWMFIKSANGDYYFTKGDDKSYQNSRLTYDNAVITSGDVALYDNLFVHLRDNDGAALVTADRVSQLLRNYKHTIEYFGVDANPKMLCQHVLIQEVEELSRNAYDDVCLYQNMEQCHSGLVGIRYKHLLGVAQNKLATYNSVIGMMYETGNHYVDRTEFEALFD